MIRSLTVSRSKGRRLLVALARLVRWALPGPGRHRY